MSFLYRLSTQSYFTAVKLASAFNPKARLMISGRKNWRTNLTQQIDKNSSYIWVHCASLGEFEQGRPLIEKLKKEYGEKYKIILTFFSPSGFEIRKNYDKADVVCYMPFDTPSNARDFINIVNPVCAVFVKYEIWYYHLKELKLKNIPSYLISGIFRENQIFFRWFGKSYKEALGFFTHFFLQDNNSENILKNAGLENTTVCGDTRTDRVISVAAETYENKYLETFSSGNKTLVCGSTWPADEKFLAEFANKNNDCYRFIIVPHETNESHLKHIENIINIPNIRFSNIDQISSETRVVIVDSIGLLSKIYRYAHIAYIGGGFGKGIHNTLEAAVYNIPVIFGPRYEKFREARELIDLKCGFSVKNYSDLENIIFMLVKQEELYLNVKKGLSSYISSSFGATDKIFNNLHFREC
jgi:3-deoxy-D-manno-octulosonic-acid transferase